MNHKLITATGKTELGPTELAFAVNVFERKVVVNFGTPIASLEISAQEAKQLATLLRRKAGEIKSQ